MCQHGIWVKVVMHQPDSKRSPISKSSFNLNKALLIVYRSGPRNAIFTVTFHIQSRICPQIVHNTSSTVCLKNATNFKPQDPAKAWIYSHLSNIYSKDMYIFFCLCILYIIYVFCMIKLFNPFGCNMWKWVQKLEAKSVISVPWSLDQVDFGKIVEKIDGALPDGRAPGHETIIQGFCRVESTEWMIYHSLCCERIY